MVVPLGNILTGVGCFGALVMLPHLAKPEKMCKMFLTIYPDGRDQQEQLHFMHFSLFSNLFWLAVTVAVAGQTCPCPPVAIGFMLIIFTRIIQVFIGFRSDLLGLAKGPVMMQVAAGTIIIVVTLVATVLAMQDEEYLAAKAAMEAIAFDKMETAAPLVYFIVGVSLFFALMSAPGICMAEKMIDGYIPSALRLADKYAGAQMQFYMAMQSREQFFFWLLLAALFVMSPDIAPIGVTVCCMSAYFIGFCIYAISNQVKLGLALPGMLFWLIMMSFIFGATALGLTLI